MYTFDEGLDMRPALLPAPEGTQTAGGGYVAEPVTAIITGTIITYATVVCFYMSSGQELLSPEARHRHKGCEGLACICAARCSGWPP